jgi:hypothetical protein
MNLNSSIKSFDVSAEQDKADFMEILYQYYKPENNCFTGLWEEFKTDVALILRNEILSTLKNER